MKQSGLFLVILAVVATAWLRLGAFEHHPGGPPPHDPPARIRSVQGDILELEQRGGWRKTVRVDDRTQVRRGRERGSRSDLRAGAFVIVYDVGSPDEPQEAVLIDLLR